MTKHLDIVLLTLQPAPATKQGFWTRMKDVFDAEYKDKFLKAGLLEPCGGELQHLISDAATMQIVRWTDGGFGMAAHNYDGDMLTDQIAQVCWDGVAVQACVASPS
jgi:isocitrate dehydrogenase